MDAFSGHLPGIFLRIFRSPGLGGLGHRHSVPASLGLVLATGQKGCKAKEESIQGRRQGAEDRLLRRSAGPFSPRFGSLNPSEIRKPEGELKRAKKRARKSWEIRGWPTVGGVNNSRAKVLGRYV